MAEVNDNSSIQLFEDQKIRTAWDAEKEEWYFAIVDVIAVLTDSADPQNYWRVLKKRLKDEGNETITNFQIFARLIPPIPLSFPVAVFACSALFLRHPAVPGWTAFSVLRRGTSWFSVPFPRS